jgi:hypothetical protein
VAHRKKRERQRIDALIDAHVWLRKMVNKNGDSALLSKDPSRQGPSKPPDDRAHAQQREDLTPLHRDTFNVDLGSELVRRPAGAKKEADN